MRYKFLPISSASHDSMRRIAPHGSIAAFASFHGWKLYKVRLIRRLLRFRPTCSTRLQKPIDLTTLRKVITIVQNRWAPLPDRIVSTECSRLCRPIVRRNTAREPDSRRFGKDNEKHQFGYWCVLRDVRRRKWKAWNFPWSSSLLTVKIRATLVLLSIGIGPAALEAFAGESITRYPRKLGGHRCQHNDLQA